MPRHGGAPKSPKVTAAFVPSFGPARRQPPQVRRCAGHPHQGNISEIGPYLGLVEDHETLGVKVSYQPKQGRGSKRGLVSDVLQVSVKAHFLVHLHSENLDMILEWQGLVTQVEAPPSSLYCSRGPRNDHHLGLFLGKIHLPVLSQILD